MNLLEFYASGDGKSDRMALEKECRKVLDSIVSDFPEAERAGILKRILGIELEPGMAPADIGKETEEEYPRLVFRGSCGGEGCSGDGFCLPVSGIRCCQGGRIGYTGRSRIRYPEFWEVITDLAVWLANCPSLEAVCAIDADRSGMHIFRLKDNKIIYLGSDPKDLAVDMAEKAI